MVSGEVQIGKKMVLVVEDDESFAKNVVALAFCDLWPVHISYTMGQALTFIEAKPRLAAALVDLGLPDGVAWPVLEALRAEYPRLPIAVVTGDDSRSLINRIQAFGAEYILKDGCHKNLRLMATRVFEADILPTDGLQRNLRRFAKKHRLSPRETDIVTRDLAHQPRDQIGRLLGVSVNTLKTEIRSLLKKCGMTTMQQVARAIFEGESLDVEETPVEM